MCIPRQQFLGISDLWEPHAQQALETGKGQVCAGWGAW